MLAQEYNILVCLTGFTALQRKQTFEIMLDIVSYSIFVVFRLA